MSKQKQILINMNNEEYVNLRKDAHAHEMNMSEYVRFLVENNRKEEARRAVEVCKNAVYEQEG